MTDAAALLELVRDELAPLLRRIVREEFARLLVRDTLTPIQRQVAEAVAGVYVVGETFTTGELLQAARFDAGALEALLRASNGGDAVRLGILMGQVADAGVVIDGARLVRLPREAGVRRWVLEAVNPL